MLGKTIYTNRIVAKKLGIDEKKVSSVMSFYMDELVQEIQKCDHPYLYIKGLGTFGLNQAVIDKKLKTLIRRLRGHKISPEDRQHPAREKLMKNLKEQIFTLFEARRRIKLLKKTNKELQDGKTVHDNQG